MLLSTWYQQYTLFNLNYSILNMKYLAFNVKTIVCNIEDNIYDIKDIICNMMHFRFFNFSTFRVFDFSSFRNSIFSCLRNSFSVLSDWSPNESMQRIFPTQSYPYVKRAPSVPSARMGSCWMGILHKSCLVEKKPSQRSKSCVSEKNVLEEAVDSVDG